MNLCKVCGKELSLLDHVVTVGEGIPGSPYNTVFSFKCHADCLSDEAVINIMRNNERV